MPKASGKPLGELVENRIVIWDIEESRKLFNGGFYGKPIGIAKPKGSDFDAPLILDLIEGYYLAKIGRISIYKSGRKRKVSLKSMEKICRKEYVDFEEKFFVYKKLREANYVVTPGIKFGCDFAVYERGPGIDHAPYLVKVVKPDEDITATSIVLSGRLATTVRKQFILAFVEAEQDKVNFLSFDWWRA
ncbi:MAG: tRNA-intron lyase [archaeon]|nr:tRNA-intron lyase [archaeon]MCP8306967.1 tRNA-intron lyase [archaeon]